MKTLEAIEFVEQFAEKMNLTDSDGEAIPVGVVIAMACKRFPEMDEAMEKFLASGGAPEEYVDKMLRGLRQFRDQRQAKIAAALA